jgi:predicted GTPase
MTSKMRLPDLFRKNKESRGLEDKAASPTQYDDDYGSHQWSSLSSENQVLVMGVTGAGKSYFINRLIPDSVAEGHGLESGESIRTYFLEPYRAVQLTVIQKRRLASLFL